MKQITSGDWLALWQAFRAPLIGGAVALVLALLGRWRRITVLLVAAGAAGVFTGWLLLGSGAAALFNAGPRDMVNRLPLVAAGAGVLAILTSWLAPQRGRWPCLVLLALAAGWWLAGGPRSVAALTQVAVLAGGLVAWHGLAGRHLSRGTAGRLVLAAWTFALALWVCRAPSAWLLLALTPALASVAVLLVPAAELVLLPVAIDLAAVMAATLLGAGKLPRGVGAVDVAVAAPVLAVLLAPRLRFAPALAGPVAAAVAVGLAWLAHLWLG